MKIIKGNIFHAKELGSLDIIPNGGILLDDDGTIKEIYNSIPENSPYEVVDYGNKLIMQSFADMHLHAPQFPMLGMGTDLPLLEWLNTYTFKVESHFKDVEYAREVYRKLAKDLINAGTTRVAMFSSLHTDATLVLMEELEKAGVTGYVGKVNMDRNSPEELSETTEESERETIRWINECKRFKYIKPIITPRFTPSCTNELMEWLGKYANENNFYVQSHLSENLSEVDWVHSLHPDTKQYWETYDKYGLWKSHTLMAHCVHSDLRERTAIKNANAVVVHCGDSNTTLTSGVCPVRTYLNEGVWVVLGSDIAGGTDLEMYKVIRTTIKTSKIHTIIDKDNFLSVNEAYYLGTTSGHRYFDESNGFEVGKKLHAIVVDDSSFCKPVRELSMQERFERAIYLMKSKDIIAVYSDGRKVK